MQSGKLALVLVGSLDQLQQWLRLLTLFLFLPTPPRKFVSKVEWWTPSHLVTPLAIRNVQRIQGQCGSLSLDLVSPHCQGRTVWPVRERGALGLS